MSLDASGTIAGAMTFSKWKGRNYVRQCVIPQNPQSAKQLGVRAMMRFLAQYWVNLSAEIKAVWEGMGAGLQISGYNYFIAYNLNRWQNISAPSKEYPAAEASTPLTVTTQTLTGGVGHATIAMTPSGATSIWGFAIFRDTAEITVPSWSNCIRVVEANGANAVTYDDSPLEAGTYHYRTAVINADGILGTVKADGTAVVT
jgi:hypothetical protein